MYSGAIISDDDLEKMIDDGMIIWAYPVVED